MIISDKQYAELIPILLLLTIPAQLVGLIVFDLLTQKKKRDASVTKAKVTQNKVVPLKPARIR
ncbi:MAG TPA: hypothetical protein VEF04_01795 [Blastocatellia bacterium]|nr:hypothetical protein [Blastocatellia bacterium]